VGRLQADVRTIFQVRLSRQEFGNVAPSKSMAGIDINQREQWLAIDNILPVPPNDGTVVGVLNNRFDSKVAAMKKIPHPKDVKPEPSPEISTRRTAIKRIATIISGVAAGTGFLGQVKEAFGQYSSRYTSIGRVYGSSYYASIYRNTVYGSYKPRYSSSYLSYYTSYRSHYSSVPPPYSSRYSSSR
jgi:hypothetical protein